MTTQRPDHSKGPLAMLHKHCAAGVPIAAMDAIPVPVATRKATPLTATLPKGYEARSMFLYTARAGYKSRYWQLMFTDGNGYSVRATAHGESEAIYYPTFKTRKESIQWANERGYGVAINPKRTKGAYSVIGTPRIPGGTCKWFALCENAATLTIPHPILGDVPACQRCADKNKKLGG